MKNKIILGIILTAIMFCLCGCSSESVAETERRFVDIGGIGFGGNETCIIVDKTTNVQYLFFKSGYGGGLTPLLNADGTPLLYGGE